MTKRLLAVLVFVAVATPSFVLADDTEEGTLKGLAAVRVLVESLDDDAKKTGLTKSQLQTDVELRLRKAGIRVSSTAMPSLYVNVTVIITSGGTCAYSDDVALTQPVTLDRDPSISTFAETWANGGIGLVGVNRARSAIRESVADRVDKFLNAYLSVNPKR